MGEVTDCGGGHDAKVNHCTWSDNDQSPTLATSSDDKTVRIWAQRRRYSERFDCTLVLEGHDKSVLQAHFYGAGHRLISISADRTMKIWSTSMGDNLFGGRACSGLCLQTYDIAGASFCSRHASSHPAPLPAVSSTTRLN